ncbi:MAG: Gfo/Idh/MocA family oxidoreductase [Armatimonadota bacterium]
MPDLKASVIGLGMMGERHARIWAELPYTELVSVYDIVAEKAESVASELGCQVATSLEETVGDAIDIVSICTDDHHHVEPCRAAASAGTHILLEKPLATSLQDCDAIIDACEKNGARLMVGHVVRFDPRYQVGRSAIADGAVGDIVHVYARRNNIVRSGRRIGPRTSVAYFLGVHDIDIMRWYTGAEIERVYAESSRKVLVSEGADDTIFTVMKFSDGAAGCLETCWVVPEGQPNTLDARIEVIGTSGRVAVQAGPVDDAVITSAERASRADVLYGPEVNGKLDGALRTQLEHFAECIANDEAFLISPEDARKSVAVASAIHESLETNAPVVLSE